MQLTRPGLPLLWIPPLADPEARRLSDFRILKSERLQSLFCSAVAREPACSLNFPRNLRHFRCDFLPERRPVELQQCLDFVFREMFVVDGHELVSHLIRIKILLIAGHKGVYKSLALIIIRHGLEQVLSILFRGIVQAVLHLIPRADEFQQGTDVGIFRQIDRLGLILSGILAPWIATKNVPT